MPTSGPINVTLPELFGKTLAVSLSTSAAASFTLPSAYLAQLASREIRFQLAANNNLCESTDHCSERHLCLQHLARWRALTTAATKCSCALTTAAWMPTATACAPRSRWIRSESTLPNGRLRVANLTAVPGAAIDVCKDNLAGSTPLFSNVGVGTISAFSGSFTVSTLTDFYAVPHATPRHRALRPIPFTSQ